MIPYQRDMTPEYGVSEAVSPRIRRVLANNPGPFTFLGTGTYIVGRGDVAVVDPGPDDPAHLAALRRALEGERVTSILITHSHLDHSPLAAPLKAETGATVYGRSDPGGPPGLEEASEARFKPDVEVVHGALITGPDWSLEAIATPGHASNHVCYALLEENALFSGDHVMGWSTTIVSPPDGNMGDYFASLDAVAERGFATLWPTHGPPVREVAPFLAAYKAHRLERERQIVEVVASGTSRIHDMVKSLYKDVDARLHPAAARSVLAHLIHLEATGRVVSHGPPGLTADFRPIAGRP